MRALELRVGTKVLYKDELHVVTEFRHNTPGNKRGFVQATFKSMTTGKLISNRFGTDDNLERAILDSHQCQYLYSDQDGHHFMNMEDYHSFALSEEMLGDAKYYLKENMEIKIEFFKGEPKIPMLPKVVTLKVTDSPPWVRGDSVSNNMKPAVCETGLKIQVPIFIKEGTEIKVNTESGTYVSRA